MATVILPKTFPVKSERKHTSRVSTTKFGARWWAPPPVHTLVKLLHLSIPRWSRPLVEVHTLVKLLHQSIHWWSRRLVVHACVAFIPTDAYVYLSLFRFLLVCLFVFLGIGSDMFWIALQCVARYYLGLYEFATIITWLSEGGNCMRISGSFCCLSISQGETTEAETKEHCRFHLVPRFQEHFLFDLLLVLKARPVLL